MLRAVILDFDGVITDSELTHFEAFNAAVADYGVEVAKDDYYKNYLGLTDVALIKQLIESKVLKAGPGRMGEIAERKKELFSQMIRNDPKIMEDVPEFLRMLKQHNVTAAICSGALLCEIEMILELGNLREFFEVLIGAEHVAMGKPAPDGFLLTLKKLNEKHSEHIEAGQCVVVEDSRWGLEAATAAGMHTVAITNSYPAGELKRAELIIDRLSKLTIQQLEELCT